ncbi:sugar-binding transcriptional regulator [Mangrovicella endophytica]|uniref:sugar-binding transcriptional regulator n=1 Tax=Mangrovicella endophytica TaxID=2066697 RepID=UPI000C9E87A7|nr:sugar-binding domain-containing protein [Mangrovicella endophytica]
MDAGNGHDLLAAIARRYYEGDATQAEIAAEFGLSRVKVGRLLRQAKDDGIVEVRIHVPSGIAEELERRLRARFGLTTALIAADYADAEEQRRAVAGLVASYLERHLNDGASVAVGMGRNVAAVADTLGAPTLRLGTFVCATGGALRAGEPWNADHICRKLAARFGGVAETLYAPAYVPDRELRDALMRNQTVKHTLDIARNADFALIGVGDLGEDSHMVRMGWFKREEILKARAAGVVGDLMGYDFFDIDGRERNEILGGRVVGLRLQDIRAIPSAIAIAAEPSKTMALLGALRTGVVDVAALPLASAQALLALDAATGPADAMDAPTEVPKG